jgi:hypothetical protein
MVDLTCRWWMIIVLIVYLITPNKVEDIAVFVDSRRQGTGGHDEVDGKVQGRKRPNCGGLNKFRILYCTVMSRM